jgi:hypothetical protein
MRLKHLFTAITVGLLIVGSCPLALAGKQYIALAIGKSNQIGAGLGWYQPSKEGAEADALASCRQVLPDGDCKIVLSGADACISLHWTTDATAWGAAMHSTKREAETASLADCTKTTECYLINSWCIE